MLASIYNNIYLPITLSEMLYVLYVRNLNLRTHSTIIKINHLLDITIWSCKKCKSTQIYFIVYWGKATNGEWIIKWMQRKKRIPILKVITLIKTWRIYLCHSVVYNHEIRIHFVFVENNHLRNALSVRLHNTIQLSFRLFV